MPSGVTPPAPAKRDRGTAMDMSLLRLGGGLDAAMKF